jgi:hypothetical protein
VKGNWTERKVTESGDMLCWKGGNIRKNYKRTRREIVIGLITVTCFQRN